MVRQVRERLGLGTNCYPASDKVAGHNMTSPMRDRKKGGGPEQYHLLLGDGYPARITYVRRAAPKSKAEGKNEGSVVALSSP